MNDHDKKAVNGLSSSGTHREKKEQTIRLARHPQKVDDTLLGTQSDLIFVSSRKKGSVINFGAFSHRHGYGSVLLPNHLCRKGKLSK